MGCNNMLLGILVVDGKTLAVLHRSLTPCKDGEEGQRVRDAEAIAPEDIYTCFHWTYAENDRERERINAWLDAVLDDIRRGKV